MMAVYGRGKQAAEKEIMERLLQKNADIHDLVENNADNIKKLCVIVGSKNVHKIGNCAILLVPGTVRKAPPALFTVSYGMSPRDTLTLSSIGENECVVAVQRSIPTVWGGTVERQEFIAERRGKTPEQVLAVEGALLLLGAYG